MNLTLLQYNIVSYVLLFPLILNLFNWKQPIVTLIFGGVFCVFQLLVLSQELFEGRRFGSRIGLSFLAFITIVNLLGTFFYLAWNLGEVAIACIFLLLPIVLSLIQASQKTPLQTNLEILPIEIFKSIFSSPKRLVVYTSYFCCLAVLTYQLLQSSSTGTILSPWNQLPQSFWMIYFITTVLLFLTSWYYSSKSANFLAWAGYIFLTLSIGTIIYPLGYGFDVFIHQASLDSILKQGMILPKTPYYIGQYALYILINQLTSIPLNTLVKFFTPFVASIGIPLLWFETLGPQKGQVKSLAKSGFWLSATLFLLPISLFVSNTPQTLANIFFIFLVIGSIGLVINQALTFKLSYLWIFTIGICTIHPLTGIPAIILMALITFTLYKDKLAFPKWLNSVLQVEFVIIGSIIIPLIFLLNSLISNVGASVKGFKDVTLQSVASWWPIAWNLQPNTYKSVIFNFTYFVNDNIWLIMLLLLITIILWLTARKQLKSMSVYLLSALIFVGNALILSLFIDFPDLVSYESSSYALRLLYIAFWTCIPLFAIALIWIFQACKKQSAAVSWLCILVFSWVICSNIYASYPINNKYQISRQYNTSLADFHAVEKINQLSKPTERYIVLANQQVSAAAIQRYGFSKYYELTDGQQQFYYAVPTSSQLYSAYLRMVNGELTKKTAEEAAQLVGAETVYFVINDYWDNASSLSERAKLEADDWIFIDNGKVTIFIYKFPK